MSLTVPLGLYVVEFTGDNFNNVSVPGVKAGDLLVSWSDQNSNVQGTAGQFLYNQPTDDTITLAGGSAGTHTYTAILLRMDPSA